jgi:hypothetical protein
VFEYPHWFQSAFNWLEFGNSLFRKVVQILAQSVQ